MITLTISNEDMKNVKKVGTSLQEQIEGVSETFVDEVKNKKGGLLPC